MPVPKIVLCGFAQLSQYVLSQIFRGLSIPTEPVSHSSGASVRCATMVCVGREDGQSNDAASHNYTLDPVTASRESVGIVLCPSLVEMFP
jgi:hypothetical protein